MVLCKDGASRENFAEVLNYQQSRGNLLLRAKFYTDVIFTANDDVQ
jgi:hypothetical protein